MKTPKTIGILGGMGPAAAADLFQKMLRYSQEKYGAVQDHEYPPVIMRCIPLEGFDQTGIIDEEIVRTQLVAGVVALESEGSDVIAIPCNTVHYYYDEMQAAVQIPILNIVSEVIKHVSEASISKVGLLCSESTQKTHFYQKECAAKGIEVIEPNDDQQDQITHVIEQVMGGRQGTAERDNLIKISQSHLEEGVDAVVLACTEIPMAISQEDTDILLFDSTQILAESAVDYAMHSD